VESKAVIMTTGTFLGARVHIGPESRTGGRYMRFRNKDEDANQVEPPSNEMARCIRGLGFPVDRLRTGTPPRLDWDTIDFTGMEVQKSDENPTFFSYLHQFNGFKPVNKMIDCFIARTNEAVH
jgi:tRNA uridine 5-carboxymethylaminomethyl modification enzyme